MESWVGIVLGGVFAGSGLPMVFVAFPSGKSTGSRSL